MYNVHIRSSVYILSNMFLSLLSFLLVALLLALGLIREQMNFLTFSWVVLMSIILSGKKHHITFCSIILCFSFFSVVESKEGVPGNEFRGEEEGDRKVSAYDSLDAKQICVIAFGCIIGLGLLLLIFRVYKIGVCDYSEEYGSDYNVIIAVK